MGNMKNQNQNKETENKKGQRRDSPQNRDD